MRRAKRAAAGACETVAPEVAAGACEAVVPAADCCETEQPDADAGADTSAGAAQNARPPAPCAYVYMVECADGTLYTGWTTNVSRRVAAHNAGHGAKYTRSRLPVQLRYSEQCADKSAALRREQALKRLTRAQKQRLLNVPG